MDEQKVRDVIRNDCDIDKISNVSWAAFFASNEEQVKKEIVKSQILPVFIDEAATPSMVKHCLTVILKAHAYTNPGEVPWVTADQPLFALLKRPTDKCCYRHLNCGYGIRKA